MGQSNDQRVQTEAELATELCRDGQGQQSRALLLSANPSLVTNRLWREVITKAVATSNGPSPNKSLPIFDVAIDVACLLNSSKLLATTYYRLGSTHSTLNQIPLAIDAYEKSRANFELAGLQRDLIYILADLGALFFIQEEYPKAKDYSEQSITLADKLKTTNAPVGASPDDYGRARALQTLADLSLRDGDPTEAIARLETSLGLYRQLNGKGSDYDYYIAGDLMALGRVYPAVDDYAKGLLYLNKALEIVKRLSDADMMSSLLNSIGFLYMEQEDYSQAKDYYERSLQGFLSQNNQRESARVLLNLGVIEQRQSNYDQALARFKSSLQAAKATKIREVEIGASEGIGVVLTAKKDFAAALEILNQSLAIAHDMKGNSREAEINWRSAQLYYAMGNYEQAVALANKAAATAKALRLPKLKYLATSTLGQAYAADSRDNLAIDTLTLAVDEIEAMRSRVAGRDEERQLFFEDKVLPYHAIINLLIRQGRDADALAYAERAKGRVLLDILASGKSDVAKVMASPEREQSQHLNQTISEVNERILKEDSNSPRLGALYSQLDSARLEYDSFQDSLYVAHPELSVRTGHAAGLTSTDLDHLTVDRDCAYLEYVVGRDSVTLFVLTQDQSGSTSQLKVYPVTAKPDVLLQKVNQFHDTLAEMRPTFGSAAGELYALLIEPAEQQLKGVDTICIVPDGFLWNLPFQALMTKTGHYLLEGHAIFYAPSLSVLKEMDKEPMRKERHEGLIAFGNPVIGKDEQRNTELCPLLEAEAEVKSIAAVVGPVKSKVLIGREASEKSFRMQAGTYSIVHLATHGVIDNRRPLYSNLLLTKTSDDLEDNGLLEAREIMGMNLQADLAVLSACETANGKISPGEGVMGLSWAFFVAGTRSMFVSEWKVNSTSTSQLMVNFYEALASNVDHPRRNKAQAAREAALRVMKDERYRHPFYWAGFVIIGNGS
jgi:CHAT domain-containing protein